MKIKSLHLAWTLLVACLLLFSAGWGGVWVYASQHSVPKPLAVTIGGAGPAKGSTALASDAAVRLGGLDLAAAKQKLLERKTALSQLKLTVDGGTAGAKKTTWTLAELGLSVDTKAAEAALATLETGGVWTRAKARWQFPDRLSVGVSWNQAAFEKRIRSQWGYLDAGEPVNAKRTITADDRVVYTAHKDAYVLDADAMFKTAVRTVEQALAQGWDGTLAPLSLSVKLKVVHPAVTLDRLKAQGVERRIASFSTDFKTSGAGRAYNVDVTARTLNDWVLAPGEVFDYSKVVAATNEKYGYRAAPVILNGEFVDGVGGGICQVSSTLYNAVLRAGLELVERRNHSLPVAYLPMGRDATFAEGAINFRFKNTTGKTIVIRTEAEGRHLTVKLFGTMPQNVRYTISSKTVGTIAPAVKEVPRPSLHPGSRQLLASGKSGYVVETYRSKLVNGKVVATSRVSRDTYKAQPSVYAVAPEQVHPDGHSGEKPLLEDGVAE
ncbi:VanW family protein [Paenibacillus sp. MWE-103]|uniref:VanW family protein n=1 Tax=Paenibacillus artemisiicola TaxID=1172618 RepID=A0ABS3WG06_9BACL|nr:VanW family protein [Paenibacillus artemisiicola]MBO7747259.1 VanW family protein [Paenibacillus artemisiicola]